MSAARPDRWQRSVATPGYRHPGAASGSPEDRGLLGACVAVAALTGAAVAVVGGSTAFALAGAVYMLVAIAARATPTGVVVQVLAGQLVCATLVLGPARAVPVMVVPVVAGVIASAELLAVITRRAGSADSRAEARRAMTAALTGAIAFAAVALLVRVSASGGLAAIALAAAACIALAVQLARPVQTEPAAATSRGRTSDARPARP